MRFSEERDLRDRLNYDAKVQGFNANFWAPDSGAGITADTVRNALKIGDTGAVGSMSSYTQYLYGDFEFTMAIDSLSPDSSDSEKLFGLMNVGDTYRRGAVLFDLSFDSANDTTLTRAFRAVVHGEDTTRIRVPITWDTNWGGGGRLTRFRINWEENGYTFLVNDTVVATIGPGRRHSDSLQNELLINTTIPQALRLSNRSLDTTDTSVTALKFLSVRNTRIFHS